MKIGDKVRVSSSPRAMGTALTGFRNYFEVGDEGVIVDGPDVDGDWTVQFSHAAGMSGGNEWYVREQDLEVIA